MRGISPKSSTAEYGQLKTLHCGRMEAQFEDGCLRYIKFAGVEIVRGIYGAVRDRNWRTVLPTITAERWTKQRDVCRVNFTAIHREDNIHFRWDGAVEISDTSLRFVFDGVSCGTFLKNRIGICVLHPMQLAGMPLRVGSGGAIVETAFPATISPHQPVQDIESLEYRPAPGVHVSLQFQGELFEMEDQRNWTDASFKTYCTPLDRPFPVRIQEGEHVYQALSLQVKAAEGLRSSHNASPTSTIRVDPTRTQPFPKLGTMLAVEQDSNPAVWSALRALSLDQLHCLLDLTHSNWKAVLRRAVAHAGELGAALALDVIADEGGHFPARLLDALESLDASVDSIFSFPAGKHVTTPECNRALRNELNARRKFIRLGGGTRANFAEFNRATFAPEEMDLAVFAFTPQVHAFDDHSLMETLPVQRIAAENAMRLAQAKPLAIGPITLKPRLRPEGSAHSLLSVAERFDPRIEGELGAAWLLGSIASLACPGVAALCYFESHGPLGLLSAKGEARPVFHALGEICTLRPRKLCETTSNTPHDIMAFSLTDGEKLRVFAINLTQHTRTVRLEVGRHQQDMAVAPHGYARIDLSRCEEPDKSSGRNAPSKKINQ